MFSTGKLLSKALYVVGIVAIFLAVYSQYFVPLKQYIPLGPATGYVVVYGIPVVVVTLIFGREIFSRAAKNSKSGFKYGLGLFGALTVVSFFLAFIALAIILQFDPQAANLLNKPNPVLNVPPQQAWILIAVSLLIVGPAEEYLFRGFMYGGLLNITKGKHWLPLALISSVMFASVHAYYAVTYGVASSVVFIELIAFGVAMAVTYYWTGGNLIAAIVIHGLYDATGFLGVATTTLIGGIARGILIAVGVAFAAIYLPSKIRLTPAPQTPAEQTPAPNEPVPSGGEPEKQ